MAETRVRSLAKSITWRIVATLTTVALVFFFTGQIQLAVAVGGVEVLAKLLMFYGHERAWDLIGWGKATSSHLSFNE